MPSESGSIDAAQRKAATIARRFDAFECDRCAIEIVKALGKEVDATFERLCTSDRSDVIGLLREEMQISRSGVHVGIRIGDRVFDNLHPEGMAAEEWQAEFVSTTGAPLTRESVAIQQFFGKIFMKKRFTRWLFRS